MGRAHKGRARDYSVDTSAKDLALADASRLRRNKTSAPSLRGAPDGLGGGSPRKQARPPPFRGQGASRRGPARRPGRPSAARERATRRLQNRRKRLVVNFKPSRLFLYYCFTRIPTKFLPFVLLPGFDLLSRRPGFNALSLRALTRRGLVDVLSGPGPRQGPAPSNPYAADARD